MFRQVGQEWGWSPGSSERRVPYVIFWVKSYMPVNVPRIARIFALFEVCEEKGSGLLLPDEVSILA